MAEKTDMQVVADYIFHGDPNDELARERASHAYTAHHLGLVLDEAAQLRAENEALRAKLAQMEAV